MPTTEPLTISVEEAARLLNISRTHAYLLAQRGELPGVRRLGATYRVSRIELFRWLGAGPAGDSDGQQPAAQRPDEV
jgi:excisionase family DNA binding protein